MTILILEETRGGFFSLLLIIRFVDSRLVCSLCDIWPGRHRWRRLGHPQWLVGSRKYRAWWCLFWFRSSVFRAESQGEAFRPQRAHVEKQFCSPIWPTVGNYNCLHQSSPQHSYRYIRWIIKSFFLASGLHLCRRGSFKRIIVVLSVLTREEGNHEEMESNYVKICWNTPI